MIRLIIFMLITIYPVLSKETRVDLDSFEMVWNIINEKHWDLKGSGVDWQEIHTKYHPLAVQTKNREEMRTVINKMIDELGQTHFGLLAYEHFQILEEIRDLLAFGSGITDFKVEIVEKRLMVTQSLNLNIPSALPIGTEIMAIRGVPAHEVISALEQAYGQSKQKALYTLRECQSYFSGAPGGKLLLHVLLPGNKQAEERQISLVKPVGVPQQLGNLPPMTFHFDRKKLDSSIGLITFNIFLFPLTAQFPQALEEFADCKGLIIDLRGNGGGIGFLASNLAGYLFSERGKLGTMYSKDSEINFPILPRKNIWKKPLAIIVNGGSASTSEIFAAGVQDHKRGRVFGTRSAGAALPSFIEKLPNGDFFQYAFASYLSVKGRYLEGNGVIPDEITPHTYEKLTAGKDASIEAASNWILNQITEKTNEN